MIQFLKNNYTDPNRTSITGWTLCTVNKKHKQRRVKQDLTNIDIEQLKCKDCENEKKRITGILKFNGKI
jgi:hypothetical protein